MLPYMERFMAHAVDEGIKAGEQDEVPIGCVIVLNEEIIARAHNQTIQQNSPVAHAEMIALEQAAKHTGDWRLNHCDLFVTVEPCLMCFGAIQLARIRSLYYGVNNTQTGAWSGPNPIEEKKLKTHIFRGILEDQIEKIMKDFFERKRRGG